MKKLDDIPKKEIFNVPENYFQNLPGIIQSKIARPYAVRENIFTRYKLGYALAALLVFGLAAIFWPAQPVTSNNAEAMLELVETSDLIAYLQDSELSTEDILEEFEFNQEDLEAIENETQLLPFEDAPIEDVTNEIGIDSL